MKRERCERQADDDCICNVAPVNVGWLVGLHGWPFSWLVPCIVRDSLTVCNPCKGKFYSLLHVSMLAMVRRFLARFWRGIAYAETRMK